MPITVVKVGGSLLHKPEELRVLCDKLSELSKKNSLVLVPGGADFADCVRDLDRRFCLSPFLVHRMAILGMDQYGLLLLGLLSNFRSVDRFEDLKVIQSDEGIVFLPSRFMFETDPLENSWDVTSDSIAAFIAGKLGIERVLLVKDVDGVFSDDPKVNPDAKLLSHLSANQLLKLNGKTCLDAYLAKVLLDFDLKCYVINGFHPKRICAVLENKETICTLISR